MCDYSGKLIAWLDRELGDDQMAEVQKHVQECLECRMQLANYEQVTKAFDVFCDAAIAVESRRRQPRWVSILSAAAALALASTLAWTMLRPTARPVAQAPLRAAPVARPNVVPATTQAASRPAPRWHTTPHVRAQAANTLPPEPAIQVTIPAEDMFPPGAVPEGVSFTADMSLGPDGSAQQVRLRPRLVGFERRTN
jgi:hypothetical protein